MNDCVENARAEMDCFAALAMTRKQLYSMGYIRVRPQDVVGTAGFICSIH